MSRKKTSYVATLFTDYIQKNKLRRHVNH